MFFERGLGEVISTGLTPIWSGAAFASASRLIGTNLGYNKPLGYGRSVWKAPGGVLTFYPMGFVYTPGDLAIYDGNTPFMLVSPWKLYSMKIQARVVNGTGAERVNFAIHGYTASSQSVGSICSSGSVSLGRDWQDIDAPSIAYVSETAATGRMWLSRVDPTWTVPESRIEIRKIQIEQVQSIGQRIESYFDGSTPDTSQYDYSWEGTPDNSTSVLKTWYI